MHYRHTNTAHAATAAAQARMWSYGRTEHGIKLEFLSRCIMAKFYAHVALLLHKYVIDTDAENTK